MMFFASIGAVLNALQAHVIRTPLRSSAIVVVIFGFILSVSTLCVPPLGFSRGTLITIPEEASFREVAEILDEKGVVSSSFIFRVLARITGSDREVHAGRYLFEKPEGMLQVLSRLSSGSSGINPIRITFPEGLTTSEMGEVLSRRLPDFDVEEWNRATEKLEGYLFPDTYDFYADVVQEEVIKQMRSNFDSRTNDLRIEAESLQKDFSDVIIMASLIEKEANTEEDRRIVSGILWSRLEHDVALQVDAVFGYIHGISGYEPTGEDPEIDSAYNTYLYRGLPPGPIGNPGLDSIDAALHPTETDYFYYLTGEDGKMYYAETFEEHKANQQHLD